MLPRLHRLFAADGRCLDVAVDHGFFNEGAFLSGIEDIAGAVATLVDAAPDAIQLAPGQAHHLQALPGPRKPALVMRTDVANVYAAELPRALFSAVVEDAVGRALRLDAACVVVNLLLIADQPELHGACVRNVSALRAACEPVGMPLMVEPLVMKDGYGVDGDVEKIVPLVRQAAELGADVIKADPTDRIEDYNRVVEAASGRPVLVRGGGRVSDEEVLARTQAVIEQGASGIVYGRNIIQHADPAGMTRALMAVVHA
jgi:class I fructose-bisphosphate aldolase